MIGRYLLNLYKEAEEKIMGQNDSLLYKENLAEAKEYLRYWWNCDVKDRIAALVTSARQKSLKEKTVKRPENLTPEEYWTNFDYRLFVWEQKMNNTYFGGEAIPALECDLGVGNFALYLGATPVFQPEHNTIWHEPVRDLYNNVDILDNWENNKWWKTATELLKRAVLSARNKSLVPIPNLHEGLDTLASLRGTNELLVDLIECPQNVHQFLRKINLIWFDCYEKCYNLTKDSEGGSIFSAHNTWAPGRHGKIQCDFSALISPKMFEEFVMPYLSEQCSKLDYTWYHMDGPGQIPHLDQLLMTPNLHGIQWSPGARGPGTDSEQWIPMYKKIQNAGKCLFVDWLDPKNGLKIVKQLSPKGLLVGTHCKSETEVKELLNMLRI